MYIRTHLTTSYSVFYVYLYHYLRIGGFGVDFSSSCDNVSQRLQDVSTRLLQYGVTSFCPTLVTSSSTVYKEVVDHWIAPTTVCSVTYTHYTDTHTHHTCTHTNTVGHTYICLLWCAYFVNFDYGTIVHVMLVCLQCLLALFLTFLRFYRKFKWHWIAQVAQMF